jgi:hypothetical protein
MAEQRDVEILQERVYDLCGDGNTAELTTLLVDHPELDVNEYKHKYGCTALHRACNNGHAACAQLLVDHKADVNAKGNRGSTALHGASSRGFMDCVKLLVQSGADVNGVTNYGFTPLMGAVYDGHVDVAQYLLNHKADVQHRANVADQDYDDRDALSEAMIGQKRNPDRAPGLVFAVLSCDTDAKNVKIDHPLTANIRDSHIEAYQRIQAYIDECHSILVPVLSEHVEVDTRVGRNSHGLYHECLERVLQYLGLSMSKDQTVNRSIDGEDVKRALIPGHLPNAIHWFNKHEGSRG